MSDMEKMDMADYLEKELSQKYSLEGAGGLSQDHMKFQDLDEGRIPTPVPIRVKSGSFDQDFFRVATSGDTIKIPWNDVDLLALGIIKEELGGGNSPKSRLRVLVRHYLMGEDRKSEERPKSQRETYLMDIYVAGKTSPYRIDSASVNYRSFLDTPGYISADNFRRLLQTVVEYADNSTVEPGLSAFLDRRKDSYPYYKTVYDFELECQRFRGSLAEGTNRPKPAENSITPEEWEKE